MNLLSNENGELIFKAIGALFAFLSLRWIMKIFAGEDGKIDKDELKKVTAFLFFLWAAIYIIVKEANRPLPEGSTEHIFSETWIFFVFSGLLTVLSLEKIFDSLSKLIEVIIKLRSYAKPTQNTDSSSTGGDSGVSTHP
jgi:hypothetical protein